MFNPLLAVCLIVRDCEDVILKLLDSLQRSAPGDGEPRTLVPDHLVVVDTGSTDQTREKVLEWLRVPGLRWPQHWFPPRGSLLSPSSSGLVTLDRYEWCDDFSAARNHAFALTRAKWRMYLDSDDVWPGAKAFRRELVLLERRSPQVNAVLLPYDYAPGVRQLVTRCVRWEDGWEWRGAIHEALVPTGRKTYRATFDVPELTVEHRPADPDDHADRSAERNSAIIRAAYARETGAEKLRLAYYMGKLELCEGRPEEAEPYLIQSSTMRGNFSAYSWVLLAGISMARGEPERAIERAGCATARCPEIRQGWAMLVCAHHAAGDMPRAIAAWDRLRSVPEGGARLKDGLLEEGEAPARAAHALILCGQVEAAEEALVACQHRDHPEVTHSYRQALLAVRRAQVKRRIKDACDALVWCCEPLRAIDLLGSAPDFLDRDADIQAWRRDLLCMTEHDRSEKRYAQAYASIPPDPITRAEQLARVAGLGRTRAAMAAVRRILAEQETCRIVSVGAWDGAIEELLLGLGEGVTVTLVDVTSGGNEGAESLASRFPGRVAVRRIGPAGRWIEETEGPDLVLAFEVLEHVPGAKLYARLSELETAPGRVLVSTPNQEHWIEPHLAGAGRPPFYGHLRGMTPDSFHPHDTWGTEGGAVLLVDFAELERREQGPPPPAISILCLQAPPFDPISLAEGHCGGSEEAVIHLARQLVVESCGARVKVFAPRPERDLAVFRLGGVEWHQPEDYDAIRSADEDDLVIVWRSPAGARDLRDAWYEAGKEKLPGLLLWLHDTEYGAAPDDYRAADGVLDLSDYHAQVIEERDGFAGPFVQFANAVALSHEVGALSPYEVAPDPWLGFGFGYDFGGWPEVSRDPLAVVYCSSPDRGLDKLLEVWPAVVDAVPGASLHVYYGFGGVDRRLRLDPEYRLAHGELIHGIKQSLSDLEGVGVHYHGGVSHAELHRSMAGAGVWAYPTDFEEISCISAMKAQAAGLYCLHTGKAALAETAPAGPGVMVASREDFGPALVEALARSQKLTDGERIAFADRALDRFRWRPLAAEVLEWIP